MSDAAVEAVIVPPLRDLGDGFTVRRALPAVHRRMVGPFIFLDELGPIAFTGDRALDVRPHPHIGLATITHLIEGEILHRDSLGHVQPIRPGAVNWMTAGRGIVHSERTPPAARGVGARLHAIQLWVALPVAQEEIAPSFRHYPAQALPVAEDRGVRLALLAGVADGMTAPVETASDMILAELMLAAGGRYAFGAAHVERAVYVVSGAVRVEGQEGAFAAGQLVVLKPGAEVVLAADMPSRLMLVGGEPFPERRYVWWNFVSSRPERIEAAKADWRAGRFDGVAGDDEFIPLPPDVPGVRLV
ncbi:pirin family protein [Novosphingobium sp. Fuku2-ISO-50]|uniref:pirin family protein n=1 Tax=Novosphingobium sp. Fuku2-ISO-50 TaxID=1739114 RepID=UPI00076C6572|nr:pirin family protein [Novosphingobium sp. Fuku2-ISO-50]KUR76567.1 pirin [Novosphingobium sp. Fuku2-ISO-50]